MFQEIKSMPQFFIVFVINLGPPQVHTFVMEEQSLSACGRVVEVRCLESNDEFVAEWRVDNGSSMSDLTQSDGPSTWHCAALFQRREHRTRRVTRCQVWPPARWPTWVVGRRGRRVSGCRRPGEVVCYDGDALTRPRRDEPRTVAAAGGVCVDGGQVTRGSRQGLEPWRLAARTATCWRQWGNPGRTCTDVISDVIDDCTPSQSSDYKHTTSSAMYLAIFTKLALWQRTWENCFDKFLPIEKNSFYRYFFSKITLNLNRWLQIFWKKTRECLNFNSASKFPQTKDFKPQIWTVSKNISDMLKFRESG